MNLLLSPPVAFTIYILAISGLLLLSRGMAAKSPPSPFKTDLYASGNAPQQPAVPGYRTFFVIALFFAALHLGGLLIGSSDRSPTAMLYIAGLALTLLALLIG